MEGTVILLLHGWLLWALQLVPSALRDCVGGSGDFIRFLALRLIPRVSESPAVHELPREAESDDLLSLSGGRALRCDFTRFLSMEGCVRWSGPTPSLDIC